MIKNKEGKIFELRGPNPLMEKMRIWNEDKIELINFCWDSEIVKDKSEKIVFEDIADTIISNKLINPQEFIKEIQEIQENKDVEDQTEIEIPEPKQIVINVNEKTRKILKERGVEFFCAPVIGFKEFKDDLYENSYKTIEYGEKFVFDAIIVDQNDFQLNFWAIKKIEIESIIHKKNKQGGERWWKIKNFKEKTGGWIYSCFTSDVNPDFS